MALSSDAAEYTLLMSGDTLPRQADVIVWARATPSNRPSVQGRTFEVPADVAKHADRCRQYGEFMVFDLGGRCSTSGPVCAGLLAARSQRQLGFGETKKVPFAKAGTFYYVCQPHAGFGMKGEIVVK